MAPAIWIDDAPQLEKFCREIGPGPLAVDTESDHFHAYDARVCLIQLATERREALVDPLAISEDGLAPLFEVFGDRSIPKVLHAARNDIIEIDRDWNIPLTNLFDTQVAARFLDYERNSLNWMLENLLDVDTGDQYQRFDWTTRPLPDEVRRYAVDDVRHLLDLQDRFQAELADQGWLEAFRQQCTHIVESASFVPKDFDPEGWRKLRNTKTLDGPARAALASLFRYRHRLCTRRNRAAVTIFPNGVLMRLARHRPTTPEELGEIRGMPGDLLDDCGEAICSVIRDAQKGPVPPADRQKPKKRSSTPSPQERQRYNALRKWRNDTATRLRIPGEFIATNATLSEISAENPRRVEELRRFDAILPWHIDLLGDEILGVLRRI